MNDESKIEAFETNILPTVKEDVLEIIEYFESEELPSVYSSCVQMYLANFMGLSAKVWDEHCDDYGIKIEFKEIDDAIERVKKLDQYVKDYN